MIKQQVVWLRSLRKWHRRIGLALAVFLSISAVSGLLLGWKKQLAWLQPPTQKSERAPLSQWLPLDSLAQVAVRALRDSVPALGDWRIARMDVRPGKGIVKVRFESGWWEVQLEGTTAKVRSVARRHADWIEHIHDGSIVSEGFKLLSMNVLGVCVLALLATGWWLWWSPRRIRARKRR